MAESVIPVDLFNPGQVFACLGLMESAEVLLGEAKGCFSWDGSQPEFHLDAAGDQEPVEHVLAFLATADVVAGVPDGWEYDDIAKKWGVNVKQLDSFPFSPPSTPATLPAILRSRDGKGIQIDHWGDSTRRDNVKFWAGAGGYPGAALARDALSLARGKIGQYDRDPFALSELQSSSTRFDWRRDYIPLDAGFSPNDHQEVQMIGFPLVEILAAIGLSHARPACSGKLCYSYGVIGGGASLDPIFIRAALGSASSPVPGKPFRCFAMDLGWPGQQGQARCIKNVTELSI